MSCNKCTETTDCGCGSTYLTTPSPCPAGVDCDGNECPEMFDANCTLYTGATIDSPSIPQNTSLNTVIQTLANAGSTVYAVAQSANLNVPKDVAVVVTGVTQALVAGTYIVDFTALLSFLLGGEKHTKITFGIYVDGVLHAESSRIAYALYFSDSGLALDHPICTSSIKITLAAAGTIDVRAFRTDPGSEALISKGVMRIIKCK